MERVDSIRSPLEDLDREDFQLEVLADVLPRSWVEEAIEQGNSETHTETPRQCDSGSVVTSRGLSPPHRDREAR
jgi:hypothetical protein